MPGTVSVGSSAEFAKLLSNSTIVVTDFYADWCGPCKVIAPTFESLANKYAKPNRITFAKVNVDSQQAIAQQYGVRAMPTFLIFRSGTVVETVQGADARSLTNAVEKAIKLVGSQTSAYASAGRTLGGTTPRSFSSLSRPFNFKRIVDSIIAFLGLYFITLFSFDAYTAGEKSPFNVNGVQQDHKTRGNATRRTEAAAQAGRKLGTISDITSRE